MFCRADRGLSLEATFNPCIQECHGELLRRLERFSAQYPVRFDGTVLAAPSVDDLSSLSRTQAAPSRIVTDPCLASLNLDMNNSAHTAKFHSASVVTYRSLRNLTGREKKHLLQAILQIE